MNETRIFSGDIKVLKPNEALAACGRCGKTIVVTLHPNVMQEFYYCSPRCKDQESDA